MREGRSTDKRVDWQPRHRQTFYKRAFNENHIPNQTKYEKIRKQRLDQWDNPKYNWPPKMPRPTMHRDRTLLNHIDSEERQKIEKSRDCEMPNYRTGDILEVTQFLSLSEGKFNQLRGMVIGKAKPNNLR